MKGLLEKIPTPIRLLIPMLLFYTVLKTVISPPLPHSLILMYMTLATIGTLIYTTLFYNLSENFIIPFLRFLAGSSPGAGTRYGRWFVLALVPMSVWWWSFSRSGEALEAPLESRVIHPSPPGEFMGLYNPFRVEDKAAYAKYVLEGKTVFYRNCIFCHGDMLDGHGIFADRLNPNPANFQDSTTISMLQESYVFWRVSKGGPGLPQESTPWNSAMPRWETMLSEHERWKVILFLYEYTGYKPRTWE
jgi:mono/diheme cytochrome c family protein